MHRILALASQMLSYLAKFVGDTVAVSYNLRCTDRDGGMVPVMQLNIPAHV